MTARNGHAPSGTGMGFLFWISHVRRLSCNPLTTYRLPLTTYQLPLAICHCHSPPPASPARRRVRGYILSLCHFALDDTFFNLRAQWETFATMGYQMTTCHEADTTFSRRNGQRMPGWLAAWLYSISIGACFKSIFIIIFFFIFFSFFYFSYFCSPWFFCICCWRWFCSFNRHYRRTMRAVCRLLLWLNVVQYSYYVGDAGCPAKSGTVLKAAIKVGMRWRMPQS